MRLNDHNFLKTSFVPSHEMFSLGMAFALRFFGLLVSGQPQKEKSK